jgi:hypothetical protein
VSGESKPHKNEGCKDVKKEVKKRIEKQERKIEDKDKDQKTEETANATYETPKKETVTKKE